MNLWLDTGNCFCIIKTMSQGLFLYIVAVLLCNLQQRGEKKFAFKVLRAQVVISEIKKFAKTSANVGSNLTDHYCYRNSWRPTQAVALGKATLTDNKQRLFSWVDSVVHHALTICFYSETAKEQGSMGAWGPHCYWLDCRSKPFLIASEHKRPELDERPSTDCGRNERWRIEQCQYGIYQQHRRRKAVCTASERKCWGKS